MRYSGTPEFFPDLMGLEDGDRKKVENLLFVIFNSAKLNGHLPGPEATNERVGFKDIINDRLGYTYSEFLEKVGYDPDCLNVVAPTMSKAEIKVFIKEKREFKERFGLFDLFADIEKDPALYVKKIGRAHV